MLLAMTLAQGQQRVPVKVLQADPLSAGALMTTFSSSSFPNKSLLPLPRTSFNYRPADKSLLFPGHLLPQTPNLWFPPPVDFWPKSWMENQKQRVHNHQQRRPGVRLDLGQLRSGKSQRLLQTRVLTCFASQLPDYSAFSLVRHPQKTRKPSQ
ncbi:unnamed protein product [Caretta caretta]